MIYIHSIFPKANSKCLHQGIGVCLSLHIQDIICLTGQQGRKMIQEMHEEVTAHSYLGIGCCLNCPYLPSYI